MQAGIEGRHLHQQLDRSATDTQIRGLGTRIRRASIREMDINNHNQTSTHNQGREPHLLMATRDLMDTTDSTATRIGRRTMIGNTASNREQATIGSSTNSQDMMVVATSTTLFCRYMITSRTAMSISRVATTATKGHTELSRLRMEVHRGERQSMARGETCS
jgi:hypothetical protein